jgi:hypothetical protein
MYDAFLEASGQATHMVTEHLMVGDFPGFMKGIFDYFTNQSQLFLFYYVFSVCYFNAMFFAFWLND